MTTAVGHRVVPRLAAGRSAVRFVLASLVYGPAALIYFAVTGHSGQPPLAAVVGVTILVALLLWLVDGPVDRLATRVLLGEDADGYQVMQALTRQLASMLPVDEVAPRVAEAACRTTGRSRAEVRLRLTDGDPWVRSWPPSDVPIGRGTTVEVRHTGAAVGEIAVEEDDDVAGGGLSPWDRHLLDTLARPAGPALSTVRLTVELRQRKVELERLTETLRASRERLLTARAQEQHRMRAEVATRVGSHLAAALAAVDECALPRRAGSRTGAVDDLLVQVAREAGLALDELRSIARGIFPPTLASVGLAASLESWLARAQVDAELDVPADLPGIRFDLTACLYFCAVTSLASLVRDDATGIRVGVACEPSPLLRIAACVAQSVGRDIIEAVTDRIEAFGGDVHSELQTDRFALTGRLPGRTGGTL